MCYNVCVLGIPIKSTLDNSTSVQYAGLIQQLADKARSVVRDLDPSNDLMFLRMRTKKHEIMVAPGKFYQIYFSSIKSIIKYYILYFIYIICVISYLFKQLFALKYLIKKIR